MRTHTLAGALLLAAACEQGKAPAQSPASASSATVSVAPPVADSANAPSAEVPKRDKAPRTDRDKWRAGMHVSAVGEISDVPWQHVMGVVPGKRAEYFDLSSNTQTVIYVAGPIDCPGQVEVEGRVMEVSAPSKRPSKAGEHFSELHLDVTSHRCLP